MAIGRKPLFDADYQAMTTPWSGVMSDGLKIAAPSLHRSAAIRHLTNT